MTPLLYLMACLMSPSPPINLAESSGIEGSRGVLLHPEPVLENDAVHDLR